MADGKISDDPIASDLVGAFVPIVQSGENKRAPADLFGTPTGWLNVMDFDATGDGATNDASFIMAAVAVADTVEGGGLVFPAPSAHYQISSAITVEGSYPVTFLGVGQPELRTDYAGAAISVGSGPATEQGFVTLKDFKLWGDPGSVTGIRAQFAVNLLLDGLSLYQIGTLGAYLSDCYSLLVDRCQFNDCGNAALYMTRASMNRGVISRSKFVNHDGPSQCGINILADGSMHHGGLITGCDFEFNTNGIKCADISGLHIADCYFEENDFHILAETTCDNIKITDCQFLGPGVVDLSDVDGVTLDNLVFYGTGTVLDLTGCTNVSIGRLYFPNGGTVTGLDDQRLVGHYVDIASALSQNPRLQVHTINSTRPAGAFYRWSADNGAPSFSFVKSRGASPGAHTIVQADDPLGSFIFRGSDGSGFWNAASFAAFVDGTPGSGDMPGRLVFSTSADGTTSLVERLRIGSDGLITIAAGQIKFPASANPSADANTLDDYEEGTFTPTIIGTGTAGAGTYSVQAGRYTKVGDRVQGEIELVWSAHTGTTNMKVAGLPFSQGARKSPVALSYSALTFAAAVHGYVEASAATIALFTSGTGAAEAALPIDAAATLRISFSYSIN